MKIFYYTRTGRSKAVADKLADKCNQTACEITDNEKWSGALGFIKGGAKAKKLDLIEISYEDFDQNKELVLIFPLWAGTYPPAIRTFLTENKCHEKITLIPTSLATKLKERDGFKNVFDLIGKDIMSILTDEMFRNIFSRDNIG